MQKLKEVAVGSAQYRVTLRCTKLRGTWHRAVSYCAELQKNTNTVYLGENETKTEIILTHWHGQNGSIDEKNQGSKLSLDCPFKEEGWKYFSVLFYFTSQTSWTNLNSQIILKTIKNLLT